MEELSDIKIVVPFAYDALLNTITFKIYVLHSRQYAPKRGHLSKLNK